MLAKILTDLDKLYIIRLSNKLITREFGNLSQRFTELFFYYISDIDSYRECLCTGLAFTDFSQTCKHVFRGDVMVARHYMYTEIIIYAARDSVCNNEVGTGTGRSNPGPLSCGG